MKRMNVAYLRVSTEGQTEKFGLDVQKNKILEYCEKNNVIIKKWYVDGGFSGSKLDRPEIQKLLADAESGLVGTVYVYKLDRLSRDSADTLELMYKILPKYNVKVVSMTEEIRTENPMDKVMLTMNAAMNQYEREVLRMRMDAGALERVKKGYWPGNSGIPYGYWYDRNDGILKPVPEEAEIVRKVFKLYIEGYSYLKIATILGLKNDTIAVRILRRKTYVGFIPYRHMLFKGLHEPIIDEETFNRAQELNQRRRTPAYNQFENVLSGLCFCGYCGARIRYQKWANGVYHLHCYSRQNFKKYMIKDKNCPSKSYLAKPVETEVESAFKEFCINIESRKDELSDNVPTIKESMSKSKTKIKKMYDRYFDNPTDTLADLISEEERKYEELKAELEKEILEKSCQKSKKKLNEKAISEIKTIADIWDDLSKKEKNKVLKECVEKVVITGDKVDVYFRTF